MSLLYVSTYKIDGYKYVTAYRNSGTTMLATLHIVNPDNFETEALVNLLNRGAISFEERYDTMMI